MFRVLRIILCTAAIYLFFRIGWPEGGEGGFLAASYHMVVPLLLLAGAIGIYFLIEMIQFASRLAEFGVELAFLAAVAGILGYTLPQKSGVSPLRRLLNGERPTQTTARQGLAKLGIDPNSSGGAFISGLFPKK